MKRDPTTVWLGNAVSVVARRVRRLLGRSPGLRYVYPTSRREAQGWRLMVARHGRNIASIESSDLTVEADQLPFFRQDYFRMAEE